MAHIVYCITACFVHFDIVECFNARVSRIFPWKDISVFVVCAIGGKRGGQTFDDCLVQFDFVLFERIDINFRGDIDFLNVGIVRNGDNGRFTIEMFWFVELKRDVGVRIDIVKIPRIVPCDTCVLQTAQSFEIVAVRATFTAPR